MFLITNKCFAQKEFVSRDLSLMIPMYENLQQDSLGLYEYRVGYLNNVDTILYAKYSFKKNHLIECENVYETRKIVVNYDSSGLTNIELIDRNYGDMVIFGSSNRSQSKTIIH